ncbi:MAG TPA: hypothetical protein DD473_19715 [Planctomycetaceae bacterium]|nr:hypothetical protein [Planctomycetaceae bacterium]
MSQGRRPIIWRRWTSWGLYACFLVMICSVQADNGKGTRRLFEQKDDPARKLENTQPETTEKPTPADEDQNSEETSVENAGHAEISTQETTLRGPLLVGGLPPKWTVVEQKEKPDELQVSALPPETGFFPESEYAPPPLLEGPGGELIYPDNFPADPNMAIPMFQSVIGGEDFSGFPVYPESAYPEEIYVEQVSCEKIRPCCDPCSPWFKIFQPFCSQPQPEGGIGEERVMFAPFLIETPLPQNYTGLRFDFATGLETPDRSELFWARQGIGPPLNENEVNYQDMTLALASGGKYFSTTTKVPIRFINPDINDSTVGLGDLSIATRLLIIDGDHWKLTQYFNTIMPTGSRARGLGTGHTSLEPGFLAQLKWTDKTYFFGDLRYQFPIGGDPVHSGQRLMYGLGMSTVQYQTDIFAVMPTFELLGWSALDGAKTLPSGLVVDVDSETAAVLSTGLRFVLGPAGDLGLFEAGINTAMSLNDRALYQTLTTVDFRFVY